MNAQATSLTLSLASFRFDTIGSLLGGGTDVSSGLSDTSASFSDLLDQFSSSSGLVDGRNMSLRDPESGYGMMTNINRFEMNWKAEFAELSAMDTSVEGLDVAVDALGEFSADASIESILSSLQAFVAQYNDWVEKFAADLAPGGILDNTQAAEITVHELEASVGNVLNGSLGGFSGLRQMGISIDPKTHKMTLDTQSFEAALTSNKSGVLSALRDFAKDFSGAAACVTGEGKFIDRQLDNLDRVLDYLRDNMTSLRQEFGTGDAVKPEGRVAQAVQAYEKMAIA